MPQLGRVDYGSLLSAYGARGQAQGIGIEQDYEAWKRKQEKNNVAVGALQAGTQVAGMVYKAISEADLEANKSRLSDATAQLQQAAAKALANNDWEESTDAEGNTSITLGKSYTDVYDSLKSTLTSSAKLGATKRWLENSFNDNANKISTSTIGAAYETFSKARDQAQVDNLNAATTTAVNMALAKIQGHNLTPDQQDVVLADTMSSLNSILDAQNWSPEQKEAYRQKMQGNFAVQYNTGMAKSLATTGGMDAVDKYIGGLGFDDTTKGAIRKFAEEQYAQDGQALANATYSALKTASDAGAPMGSTLQALIGQAPEFRQAGLEAAMGEKRDALMKEQFNGKFTAINTFAGAVALWKSIKYNEPGSKGYTGQYAGAQMEQEWELRQLQAAWGIDDNGGSTGESNPILDGIKSEFISGAINAQEAIKMAKARGIWDSDPTKATSFLQFVVGYDYPNLSASIKDINNYISEVAKKNSLSPERKQQLSALLNDTVRQAYLDNPKMSNADIVALESSIVNAVVGKGSSFMTELSTPGWFTSTDDSLGKFLKRLEDNPTLAAASAWTEASFDYGQPVAVKLNAFMAPHIQQLADRGRGLVVERLISSIPGIQASDVVQSFQSEGQYDITALPTYTVADKSGNTRTFSLGAPDGKLTLYETTGGKKVEVAAPAPAGSTAVPKMPDKAPAGTAPSPSLSTYNKKAWQASDTGMADQLQSLDGKTRVVWNPSTGQWEDLKTGNPVDVRK